MFSIFTLILLWQKYLTVVSSNEDISTAVVQNENGACGTSTNLHWPLQLTTTDDESATFLRTTSKWFSSREEHKTADFFTTSSFIGVLLLLYYFSQCHDLHPICSSSRNTSIITSVASRPDISSRHTQAGPPLADIL